MLYRRENPKCLHSNGIVMHSVRICACITSIFGHRPTCCWGEHFGHGGCHCLLQDWQLCPVHAGGKTNRVLTVSPPSTACNFKPTQNLKALIHNSSVVFEHSESGSSISTQPFQTYLGKLLDLLKSCLSLDQDPIFVIVTETFLDMPDELAFPSMTCAFW